VSATNNGTSKYVRQKLIELEGKIDTFTIIAEGFTIHFSTNDRPIRKKISKET
jgi:hypothetical protein